MTAPVATDDLPPPPSPGVDDRPDPRHGAERTPPGAREAAAAICPYLASEGGSWRNAAPSREHRCRAVDPPSPQPTEKQRRHCLSAEHVDCPLYRGARSARASSLVAGGDPDSIDRADVRRRPVARTAPIVLEPPRLVDQALRLQLDRAPGQIALVALMVVAFAVVAIARFSAGPATAGNPSAAPSVVAVASATPPASSAPTPAPSASSSLVPSPSASGSPAYRTTYTVKRGDTLVGIASRFKTTAAKIRALNGMANNTLKIGQVLKIP